MAAGIATLFHTMEAQSVPGMKGGRQVYVSKVYAPFSLAKKGQISQPQSITQKGVHAHLLTARVRKHWCLFCSI